MSEFEMAALHIELFNSIQASLTVFLSVLSAFLIVSYLAAHRLDRFTSAIALIAFTGVMVFSVAGASAGMRSYAALSHQMQDFADAGRGLAWHNTSNAPLWIIDAMQPLWVIGGFVMIAAALRFFFYSRRANRLARQR